LFEVELALALAHFSLSRLFVDYGMKSKLGFTMLCVPSLLEHTDVAVLDNETSQTGLCLRYNLVSF
jgi:hypothetical protein